MRLIDADKLKAELFDAEWMTDNDEHMVEEIVERQPTVDSEPVWISVEDRLPEPKVDVILIAKGWNDRQVYIGRLDEVKPSKSWLTGLTSNGSQWTVWGFSYLKEPIVTHWMPLPDTTKEDSHE